MMISVAKTIEARISSVASRTTGGRRALLAGGLAAFSRSRRTTFSTSMMASSTSAPMAIAMPAERHRVDGGAEGAEHQHRGRQRQRHRGQRDGRGAEVGQEDSTTTPRPAGRRRAAPSTTLSTATSMKSAWRKIRRSIVMPAGSSRCSASSSRRAARQLERVGARLLLHADDDGGLAVARAFAALQRRALAHVGHLAHQHGRSPRSATTVSPISSADRARPIVWSTYSCGPSM